MLIKKDEDIKGQEMLEFLMRQPGDSWQGGTQVEKKLAHLQHRIQEKLLEKKKQKSGKRLVYDLSSDSSGPVLSAEHIKVIVYLLQGKKYREIACLLNRSRRAIIERVGVIRKAFGGVGIKEVLVLFQETSFFGSSVYQKIVAGLEE